MKKLLCRTTAFLLVILVLTALDGTANWEKTDPVHRMQAATETEAYDPEPLLCVLADQSTPLSVPYWEFFRTYSQRSGCPCALALAVAEVESRFDMEAVGAAGEVGIMQLNPGPNGAYHTALEAATGLDPNTPEGNIAGGCYLLGKYLAQYESLTMVAMAYNMGQAGAERAWKSGIVSTDYTDAVLETMDRWACTVDVWPGK